MNPTQTLDKMWAEKEAELNEMRRARNTAQRDYEAAIRELGVEKAQRAIAQEELARWREAAEPEPRCPEYDHEYVEIEGHYAGCDKPMPNGKRCGGLKSNHTEPQPTPEPESPKPPNIEARLSARIAELEAVVNKPRCEFCGSDRIYSGPPDCPVCGAPQCCEVCCRRNTLEARVEALERRMNIYVNEE